MEENVQGTQPENMGNMAHGESKNGENERLFTQDEVNNIVQSRLAREKTQMEKESETEYSQKMAELQQRENKLLVKEKLSDRGMPSELADVLTCEDEDDINKKLDIIQKIYDKKEPEAEKPVQRPGFRVGVQQSTEQKNSPVDVLREAMGLKERND